MVEVELREFLEAMSERPAGIQVEAHHHRVVDRRDLDSRFLEHDPVVLEVVPDLENRGIFQQRLELRQYQVERHCCGASDNRSPPIWPTGI